jgi:hypothetical protein
MHSDHRRADRSDLPGPARGGPAEGHTLAIAHHPETFHGSASIRWTAHVLIGLSRRMPKLLWRGGVPLRVVEEEPHAAVRAELQPSSVPVEFGFGGLVVEFHPADWVGGLCRCLARCVH